MSDIDLSDSKLKKHLFHNEKIDAYERDVCFNEIKYWPENFRTELAFDKLEAESGCNLNKISLEDITNYLVKKRPELKIKELATSIENNGVRVPLIILDDHTLLDGNRRYFACSYIFHKNKNITEELLKIPVLVIKKNISEIQKHKILAEANFVSDYKIDWTPDVKAKVITDYYEKCLLREDDKKAAFDEIKDVYGLSRGEVLAYVESIYLTREYIELANNTNEELKLREQVLSKFVYFWEFRNKSLKGSVALDSEELNKVKPLFFDMVKKGFFKNTRQVESMISSYHSEDLWDILLESKGSKMEQVDVLVREQKIIRKEEDRIRNFSRWLRKADAKNFSNDSKMLLEELADMIKKIK